MQTPFTSIRALCPSLLFLLPFLLTLFTPNPVLSREGSIPDDLKQWIPWVLYEQEEKMCSLHIREGSQRYCTWPSTLDLDIREDGGSFSQKWVVETKSLVPLPGNSPHWPNQVEVNGKKTLVSRDGKHPALWLEPGEHLVSGVFSWREIPEHIPVPPETGLVRLTLLGSQVDEPQLDSQGRLWFKQQKKEKQDVEDSLSVQVYRRIVDAIPMLQQLRIHLTVSGSPRQQHLGLILGDDFLPLQFHSPLPMRLDEQNRLELQLRPGQYQIQLTLRNSNPLPPVTLGPGTIDGPWSEEEIWVFAANPKLRQLEIQGLTPVDPSRTSLPDEWKKLPAYLLKMGEAMKFVEKNRGNPAPVPNRLQLKKRLWLDEKGEGLTVHDTIRGTMNRGWRLNAGANQILGKVEVEGRPRLITRLEGTDTIGVEVRQGRLDLQAESRIEEGVARGRLVIPALGWEHNVQQLSAELNLPPGWKLLTATGVDRVATWMNHWTLLDIFLVLITSLATARILGWGWGAAGLICLVISFHQPGFPRFLWLPLLGFFALHKVITLDKGRQISRLGAFLILAIISVSSIPYLVKEVRTGLFPQLEYGDFRPLSQGPSQDFSAPSIEEALMEDTEERAAISPSKKAKIMSSVTAGHARLPAPQTTVFKEVQVDPEAMIQTGPGLPDWRWKRIQLSWNGPVKPEQELSLILLSPTINCGLSFVRVLLLTLLIVGFLIHSLRRTGSNRMKTSPVIQTGILLFTLLSVTFPAQESRAETPSPEILEELQKRLLAPPRCGQNCVSINNCTIRVDGEELTLTLSLDSQIRGGIPLPGEERAFEEIILNDQEAGVLRQDKEGRSLIRVGRGSHTIVMKKDLSGRKKFSFSFPLPPGKAEAFLQGWTINGLHEDGSLDKQLTLHRVTPAASREKVEKKAGGNILIPPAFVRVERTLHLGLKWEVSTRIIRRSPEGIIGFDLPLLPGEHVTSDKFPVRDTSIRINMGAEQNSLSFHSSMTPVETLQLTAGRSSSWSERWFLDVSPIWHVEASGIPPINQTDPRGKRYPQYHPYPGESLQLSISRPQGVDGPTMTISRSMMEIKPGLRTTETRLRFTLSASRGQQHIIHLPQGIELQRLLVSGEELMAQMDGNKLTLPVRPGKQDVEVGWRSEQGVAIRTTSEEVDLGIDSVNASSHMALPSSRWILFTGGPRMGPAVLFWGDLLVFFLLAILLGRVRLTPLSTIQWLLLSLGLTQIPAPLAALVVSWLLLLGLREKRGKEMKGIVTFNICQVLLVVLSLAALAALFFSIQQGLLGHPDMQISGNGSHGHSLHWYQDRTGPQLPTPWVISVPLLAYRIIMLLWALWLAVALLGWLRWGWHCFSDTAIWKKSPPRKKKVAAVKKKAAPAPGAGAGKTKKRVVAPATSRKNREKKEG